MPGPRNMHKRRKSHAKGQKKAKPPPFTGGNLSPLSSSSTAHSLVASGSDRSSSPSSPYPDHLLTPPLSPQKSYRLKEDVGCLVEEVLLQQPYIYDPGNGPRVRDTRAFLTSPFFVQPPALEDPLCAEFAQDEVLQMLSTVLPEEAALILWYNKSRATSRICPACKRLYRLGESLPDLMGEELESRDKPPSPLLKRERAISGLCSPVCFIMASFYYPGAIKSAWGRMADEMDDVAWGLLNGPGEAPQGEIGQILGMLVRMTRLHDLGLGQLCFDNDMSFPEDVS